MPRRNRGDEIGRWKLVDLLGQGGNAEVWQATDGKGEVALKILNQRKTTSEPYRRFRQEIEALKQIGEGPHIVPLLESHLPNVPSNKCPAWLVMPIGCPLDRGLARASLPEVVTSVTKIADTLAGLHESLQIHHRDIKPSNLYLLDGQPAISDFGLVDLPDADDLTLAGRPLGPRFFLSDEMVVDSKHADPAKADVYSLAKTLWVLCADQRWPPQGEQRASNEAYSVGSYRPHPLSYLLDQLIERCTQHEPLSRPTMRQVTDELRAWLDLEGATPQQQVDLSEQFSRLRQVAEPRLRQQRDEAAQRQCFQVAVRRFQELMDPLHREIRRQFPAAEFDQRLKFVESRFFEPRRHEITNEDIRATILSGHGWNPILLIIGIAIRTRVDGELEFGGIFYLGQTKTLGGRIDSWTSGMEKVPCDSIALETGLSELAAELQGMFPDWLDRFIAALDSSGATTA